MLRGWNIASLFPRLDKVKNHILFVHAMTGCDTTSAPYGRKEKLFEPNFEIKDFTVFVNDDARYMGRIE